MGVAGGGGGRPGPSSSKEGFPAPSSVWKGGHGRLGLFQALVVGGDAGGEHLGVHVKLLRQALQRIGAVGGTVAVQLEVQLRPVVLIGHAVVALPGMLHGVPQVLLHHVPGDDVPDGVLGDAVQEGGVPHGTHGHLP